jgi:hypothetical protein
LSRGAVAAMHWPEHTASTLRVLIKLNQMIGGYFMIAHMQWTK